MRRRHLLLGCCAALGAGLFTSLGAGAMGRLVNPCRGVLPADPELRDLVAAALDGLDAQRLVDTHAHLLGTGDSGSGCSVHPSLSQWWHPGEVLRRKAILNASCVDPDVASVDLAYVARLQALAAGFPEGARWWLFAFEQAHDDAGRPRPDLSTFHVPDEYTARVAAQNASRFDWVASIHPYREDALQRLDTALAAGAVAVKWLPGAMNIDLRDKRCRPFCERLARAGRPLIVHCGEEKAVPGAQRHDLGNPLHVRHLLAHGATVVMAHCGSLGQAIDEDLPSRPKLPAFDLFARLMAERGHGSRLLGDISAVFQRNRSAAVWRTLVERQDWHGRLLHGSDHPLPGLWPLYSLPLLVEAGLLAQGQVAALQRLREHNPLLFDLALKRSLRLGGGASAARLHEGIFEARALRA